MRTRPAHILLSLVLLLFVGSSGCESSDFLTAAEVLGGSQGVTAGDYIEYSAPAGLGGGSTGDKNKDDLIETGETMNNVKKAAELEDEANAALQEVPPNYADAEKKLKSAAELRPNDWGLINRRMVVAAENGADAEAINKIAAPNKNLCDKYGHQAAHDRCLRMTLNERENLLEASVARQKRTGTVSCTTYRLLITVYLNKADEYKKQGNFEREDHYADKSNHLDQLGETGNCRAGTAPSA